MERSSLPPEVLWWFQNYDLVRDVTTRKYAFHMVTHEVVVNDPITAIPKVIEWLGGGEMDAAIAQVDPGLRRQQRPEGGDLPEGVKAEWAEVFDEFYQSIHENGSLSKELLERMNATNKEVESAFPDRGQK